MVKILFITVLTLLFDSSYSTGHFCDFDSSDSWYQKSSAFRKENSKSLNSTNGPIMDVTRKTKEGKNLSTSEIYI